MYICLYKADIIVYNYFIVLLRDAVVPTYNDLSFTPDRCFAAHHFFSTLTQ